MNWKVKYAILGLACWLALFLAWEWWSSYPRVRLTPISHPKNTEAKIDSVVVQSIIDFFLPGLVLGIVYEEKVTYLKAFGFSDLKTKDSLSLESKLPVASVSKIFTALCLANFCLDREIPPEATINAILPEGNKLPDEFDRLTLSELLEHRSGLSDSRSFGKGLRWDQKRQLENLPYHLQSPDLENKAYLYADVNFDLIGYVMEVIAEQPFETLIQETTLADAGMSQSLFTTLLAENIHGHEQTFLWKRILPTKLKLERYPSPSSGLVLTPKDLSKALLHLCRGEMGTFASEMDWLKGSTNFPAGFQKITLNGIDFWGHFGEQDGFSAVLVYSPDREIGLFLLANAEDKQGFRKQIPETLLRSIIPTP